MTATMDNFEQYHLDNKEWIKLEQVNRFLEPLEWATKIVCDDKYPTLSVVVPVYSYLWKSVDRIFREYDARHLEPVSRAMHKKLEKYVNKAFKQESNYFATILDPKFNIKWFRDSATWPRHFWTIGYTPEAIELRFGNEASKFRVQVENEVGDDPEFGGSPIADSQPLDPMDRLFSSATEPEEVSCVIVLVLPFALLLTLSFQALVHGCVSSHNCN
ncbi:unnamed protein product [Peronospora farinosa]|uniref:Uncharacterized protein n=1 Tax=Peronospora farinosa TaxID=134698 RepID=A0AAV0TDF8_9STRA|nr:unnamed protein product [Peronospora farinosa]CAI5717738.1 unnamed protein product [Peronospora farinosa]CAI5717834.1 unnamed protein product [Peronospora farinosa]